MGKMLVVGAVEVATGAPGRIRFAKITDFSAPALHGLIVVALCTTIRTDGWSGSIRSTEIQQIVLTRILPRQSINYAHQQSSISLYVCYF